MGEIGLINYIRKNFPRRRDEIFMGIGDDAMVFKNGLVISTDSFVEGVHFDFRYFTKFSLGYRTMSASLSDLAAMGAKPSCALVSLYLPKNVSLRDIKELYRGFGKLCEEFKFDISGGDIIESPFWGITITVVGRTRKPLLRSGARAGQFLYTTGYLGLAEVGRIVLNEEMSQNEFYEAINKHLLPRPRIKEALQIKKYVTAMIDTSDGLSTDVWHLCEESRVKIIIEDIPLHPEVKKFCIIKKIDPIKFILGAGEDFELLFTSKLLNLGFPQIFKIGRVLKGRGVFLFRKNRLIPIKPTGFEHLR
uniref:Thiamine-monophosphate kinase n=1 Tax=candidate division WOR-3 bacterium TaxID=2052148 RepID=A0A7C4X986_UNCW3